ncbi:hypothetical protein [Nostoc sp.]
MRNETQHYQLFVGFRCRSTQPTNSQRLIHPNAQCPMPNAAPTLV